MHGAPAGGASGAASFLQSPNLLRDTAIGAAAGLLLQRPALGALGGLAYNLFTTPGMADGMRAAARDAFAGLSGEGGAQAAVDALGRGLFGAREGAKTQAHQEAAEARASVAEKKSGIPGWAKWLGLGGGALLLFNNLFDGLSLNGFGNPLYAGYGTYPFMDPMASMMGPMGGMGPVMSPTLNLLGGMGLMDLLVAGGLGFGAYKLLSR